MRDIKFRAWDNENEYMITSKQGIFTALQNYMNITRQDNGYYNNGDLLKPNKEKYTLMQYTGLKDRNQVEIYEGDIVELKANNGCCEMIGIIIYDEYDLAFELRDIEEGTQEYLWYAEQELEVIGNIYDNPDLLEKASD